MLQFGTGGWRAVIADGFTKANLRLLAAGLCRLMDKEGLKGSELCIGYDRRFLSKESAHWLAEVIAANGYRVLMINRSSPTPLIMYTVKAMDMPYGLMVTASHNPAVYNGVKVFTRGGRDADKSVTNRIEAEIKEINEAAIQSIDYDEALRQGLVREDNTANDYIDSILALVDTEAIKHARLRIALDPMYGVSQTCLRTILMTCRCDLEVIHMTRFSAASSRPRTPAPSCSFQTSSQTATAISELPPTATRTDSASSTRKAASFTRTHSSCCCITIWSSTAAGSAPAYATTPPPICLTAWRQVWGKPAMRCRWASSTSPPR